MNDLNLPHGDVQTSIINQCNAIRDMLIEKNRKYGNSAINPKRIFSKADNVEQINVRIDDKLSRIQSGQLDDNEDAELDLIGYLILKRVAIEHQMQLSDSINQLTDLVDKVQFNQSTEIEDKSYYPALKKFLGYDDLEG